MAIPSEQILRLKIKRLNEALWEQKVPGPAVDAWLNSFSSPNPSGIDERHHMLFLLSNFLYFGVREIRELLRSHFHDFVLRPLIRQARAQNGNTADLTIIDNSVDNALARIRFLGLGSPSESGQHLLYYYRQENELTASIFVNSIELPGFAAVAEHCPPNVDQYIIIDDFCGSSTQARDFKDRVIAKVLQTAPNVKFSYYPLFSTKSGLEQIKAMPEYSDAQCVISLDDSFKCFSQDSRFYEDPADRQIGHDIAKFHGDVLWPQHPLGYKDGQLSIGFSHNTPDNTLPIFWRELLSAWHPPFRRYHKKP